MTDITCLNPETGMVDNWTIPAANATLHRSETAALLLANQPDAPFAAVCSDNPPARGAVPKHHSAGAKPRLRRTQRFSSLEPHTGGSRAQTGNSAPDTAHWRLPNSDKLT